MQANDTPPPPAAAGDGIEQADLPMHHSIDRATFAFLTQITEAHQLTIGSAMLMAFDSICAHLAAGSQQRRELLTELLRVHVRRWQLSPTAPPSAERRLTIDHHRANAALITAIDSNIAAARADRGIITEAPADAQERFGDALTSKPRGGV